MSITTRILLWLFAGLLLFVALVFGSHLSVQLLFGSPPPSAALLLVGGLQLVGTVALYRWLVKKSPAEYRPIHYAPQGWMREAGIGLVVLAVFALLQFLVIIPATGGQQRADVVANLAQLDGTTVGALGFLGLAVLGAVAEEIFVRGVFLRLLLSASGNHRLGIVLSVVVTAVLFGLAHGYQGWAGIVDTALYGGILLSVLFVWRRSLIAPIVAHAGWNLVAGVWLWSLSG